MSGGVRVMSSSRRAPSASSGVVRVPRSTWGHGTPRPAPRRRRRRRRRPARALRSLSRCRSALRAPDGGLACAVERRALAAVVHLDQLARAGCRPVVIVDPGERFAGTSTRPSRLGPEQRRVHGHDGTPTSTPTRQTVSPEDSEVAAADEPGRWPTWSRSRDELRLEQQLGSLLQRCVQLVVRDDRSHPVLTSSHAEYERRLVAWEQRVLVMDRQVAPGPQVSRLRLVERLEHLGRDRGSVLSTTRRILCTSAAA